MIKKALYLLIPLILGIAVVFALRMRPQLYSFNKPISKEESSSNKTLDDYYTEAQQAAPAQAKTSTVTFLAVGDISLSRNIAATIQTKGDPLIPFKGVDGLLKSTDFNFGNLETPFSKSDAFTQKNTLVFNAPKGNVVGLKQYNFKVLNLANNHAFDQSLDGITTTAKILDDNGLSHMGTGKNLDDAWQPVVYEVNGIKIGFIGASYSSINDGGKATNNYVARIEDTERLKAAILSAKGGPASGGKSTTDFLVVTMHAGTEYKRNPNQGQIDFAHAAIDAGADIVIGAHPHWIQTIENYKGKQIFYSLGNFIFDQDWSQETQEGLTLKITLSKKDCHPAPDSGMACPEEIQGSRTTATLSRLELIPIIIDNNCCPREALSVEAQEILKKISIQDPIIK